MSKFKLGKLSRRRLQGVHPDLVKVVERAIEITDVDFTVVEGLRSAERQRELYAQGRTKPGRKVTWTLKSKHIEGQAVDLAPWRNGGIAWNDHAGFLAIYRAMMTAARQLGVRLRSGRDWDNDGIIDEPGETDRPHFELFRK